MQIVLTLLGVLVGVALLGWGIFAVAGALTAPPAQTAVQAAAPKAARPTTASASTVGSATVSETTPTPTKKLPPVRVYTPKTTPAPPPAPAPAPVKPATSYVVVIDPGHQANANMSQEPVGPGASTTKPKVEGGASGVVTRRPESLDNLEIALKVRDVLEAQGVTVVMVRTTQKVDIANSKRAKMANAAHADLFLRIHCDSGPSSVTGILTLVPGRNRWTGPIVSASAKAGNDVQAATVAATGHRNRGVTARTDLSGFNYATVPSVLVEAGMMSNPTEDRQLASAAYQQKLAQGIANGVMRYLNNK